MNSHIYSEKPFINNSNESSNLTEAEDMKLYSKKNPRFNRMKRRQIILRTQKIPKIKALILIVIYWKIRMAPGKTKLV